MSDHNAAIDRLLEKSNELPEGAERIGIVEEAVRIADQHADVDAGFRTRMSLMKSATFAGRPDLLLSAFAWCLAAQDREPDRFPRKDLLWNHKWAVGNVVEFPDVSRERIEAMLDDMEVRFREAGSTLHAVHNARREVFAEMGDAARSAEAAARLVETPRDWLSDCRACIRDFAAGALSQAGRDEEALAEAAPILAGRMKCSHVPHRTYSKLLLPLLRLGRVDEAMAHHHEGYRLIAGNPEFLVVAGKHMTFLALVGEFGQALEIFTTFLNEALVTPSVLSRLRFFGVVRLLLERLLDENHGTLRMRLPESFPLFQTQSTYATAELHAWFAAEVDRLAAQFDARNGNDHYTHWSADLRELASLAVAKVEST